MEELDYKGVIIQLQLENENLRRQVKDLATRNDYAIPRFLGAAWRQVMNNKMQALLIIMLVYWTISLTVLFFDLARK